VLAHANLQIDNQTALTDKLGLASPSVYGEPDEYGYCFFVRQDSP
jgi:hypothetical protein